MLNNSIMIVIEAISLTVSVVALIASFLVPAGVAIAYFVKHIKHYESCCGCLHIDTRESSNNLKEIVIKK